MDLAISETRTSNQVKYSVTDRRAELYCRLKAEEIPLKHRMHIGEQGEAVVAETLPRKPGKSYQKYEE